MAYIGTAPTDGQYTILDDISSGFNGSTTTFNLTSGGTAVVPQTDANALISISGVVQYTSAYAISGSTIVFSSAPLASDSFSGRVLGNSKDIGVPTDGTVSSSSLASTFFMTNGQTFNNISIASGKNAMAVGTITVSGTLTVPSGSTFVVL
tara:strand:+ start:2218 stop:2670 length:453 start_codon:yes stop_codon:yes gene_type:complete